MARILLSFGHGYSARALGRRLLAEGWRVIGTTRSAETAEALHREGVEPLIWPGGPVEAALASATHLLSSVPPDDAGDPVLTRHGDTIAAAPHLHWLGYLSTTGVYGDRGGDWVDEDTPPQPGSRRGHLRLAAENQWREIAERGGKPLDIFRLAGIYGPGRGPFEKIRAGTARRVIKPGQVFGRIHVDDIAQVLAAALERPGQAPGMCRVFNVCDDAPAPPEDVLAHAAHLLGVPPPPAVAFDEAGLSAMARSFYSENKRVRNRRLRDELGVVLHYPDYRAGLAAVLAAETEAET